MHIKSYVGFAIVLFIAFTSNYCTQKKEVLSPAEKVKQLYRQHIQELRREVDQLIVMHQSAKAKELQNQFLICRLTYKQAEAFAEYFNPSTAKAINGPAILEAEPDNPDKPVQPTGFQVLEESLFPEADYIDLKQFREDLYALKAAVQRLDMVSESITFNDQLIFDALRLQLFRIQILGISGFDSPLAQNSIPESCIALGSITDYLKFYPNRHLEHWQKLVNRYNSYSAKQNFNDYNRADALFTFFIPLGKSLNKMQNALGIDFFNEPRPLRADAGYLFQPGIFNAGYYSPSQKQNTDTSLVSLGKMLFFEPGLSADGSRSCASCHQPAKAFTDGLVKNHSFDGRSLILRNTPTILYAGLQPAQFADSRVAFLEDQVKEVTENPLEMHGSLTRAVKFIQTDHRYSEKFKRAFPGKEIDELKIQESISAYIRSKNAFNSRFDRYMRSEKDKLNTSEIKGFNLFMGKAKCATCHFMPLFNGNFPPHYLKAESEVLGVPLRKSTPLPDRDLGKFMIFKAEPHMHSFKTPTVRNSFLTAPYMHNGVFSTLEDVMDFYNDGGGAGMGIELNNQTLSSDKLNLTIRERKDIISFLQALTDRDFYN